MIVDAPRSLPLAVSIAAETMPTGSNPAFSQKVLSSTAVVASISHGRDLVVFDDIALDLAEAGELDLAGPIEDLGLLGEVDVLEQIARVLEALAVIAVAGHRGGRTDETEQDEGPEQEQWERDGDLGGRATLRSSTVSTMAPTSREAGLHGSQSR